jgi:N-acetylmuramoyl-L-alanine amidase
MHIQNHLFRYSPFCRVSSGQDCGPFTGDGAVCLCLYSRRKAQVLMRRNQQAWQYLKQHRMLSIVVGQLAVLFVLGSVLFGTSFGSEVIGAFAQSPCSSGDAMYTVSSGDTLGTIAMRYNTGWQKLASYNHIANANVIYINQHICVPGKGTPTIAQSPIHTLGGAMGLKGMANFFSYGQCTWWANQRYFQLHGAYVPWQTNANAWQWVARAYENKWNVSSTPSVGSIVVLQPWVQGAYNLGHVGVVERVQNGRAVVSNMNWGAFPFQISNSQITPGAGVSFITR